MKLACLLAVAMGMQAAEIPLWEGRPDKETSAIGPKDTERRIKGVTNPTLTPYIPEHGNGTAMIVVPGGGFAHLAIDKEGHDVAKWLNSLGVAAFVLKYSAGSDPDRAVVVQRSMADANQAMRLIKSRAGEWKVDSARIGIIGFSAGGYIAAELAMHPEAGMRPAFTVPIYPAAPATIEVDANTPPAFFAAANDDALTAIGLVPLYAAWTKAKRPAAVHVFTKGGHGFGIRKTGVTSDAWTDRLAEWLRSEGWLGKS